MSGVSEDRARVAELGRRIHAAAARHGITPEDLARALRRDRLISLYTKRVAEAKADYEASPKTREDCLLMLIKLDRYRAALNILLRTRA